ncbi:hypothetical protein PybrP1_004166 [[Pythium] brassicae (nom. inval.)]|nr:hypothetical protein PybrP1_004166 [[Pythium] brassicae (nom. inval.)]
MSDASNVFARFRFDAKRARPAAQETDGREDIAEPQLSPPSIPVANPSARRKKRREDECDAGDDEVASSATAVSAGGAAAASAAAAALAPVAPPRTKWQERWHGICDACFASGSQCVHHEERLLRLLVVGHNPSDHAWQSGYSYSNPTNRMWSLIVGSLPPLLWRGILPAGTPVSMQNSMPHLFGVGFTSIGLEPGNDAAKYTKETMARWKADFFRRLRAHVKRVCENQHGPAGVKSETAHDSAAPAAVAAAAASRRCTHLHGPLLIAFSGKRQFSFLFTPPLSKIESYGVQTRLPQEWPRECVPESEVWVLPSSSGRSALTHEQRSTPYRQLAERLHGIPWPLEGPHAEPTHEDAHAGGLDDRDRFELRRPAAAVPPQAAADAVVKLDCMRVAAWTSIAAAALLLLLTPGADARSVSASLTASWPSSALFPLLETSEFLADENPAHFWRFAELLRAPPQLAAIAAARAAADILELTLATRTYAAKVEMYRQLGLDSSARPCGPDAHTWAVLYSQPQCVDAVACSVGELDAALAVNRDTTATDTCIAAGASDVELDTDHKYPQTGPAVARTAILYGAIGTPAFYAFHAKLRPAAEANAVQYIARHYAADSTLETLLQGYGVALDIKNMEYKTIDDSHTGGADAGAADGVSAEEEGDDEGVNDDDDDDDDDVEGFLFNVLVQRHSELVGELKQFRDSLATQDGPDGPDDALKAWHLKDIGLAAARAVLDAKDPLAKLRALSQDFPKHAKRLAFSRKPLSDAFRAEAARRGAEAAESQLRNKFLVNGIAVDPTQRSFNIFDFMNTLKAEWLVAKQLAALPLADADVRAMLAHVRETNRERGAMRIRVRGPADGAAPFYLNDIETDPKTAHWPADVAQLTRPAWNIIFVRKNMYESVLAFDPTTSAGRGRLNEIAFMRMRGAPIQWGLLVSSKELMAATTRVARDALVAAYKRFELADRANAFHFAKLLFLARDKDVEAAAAVAEAATDAATEATAQGRIVSAFIDGVADEGTADLSVQHLVTCFADAMFGHKNRVDAESEALAVLRGDANDELVLGMTAFIQKKHLPLESSLFNGVLRKHTDIQSELMHHLGRDQSLYQELAHSELLQNDADLVEELLSSQGAFPAYFPVFDSESSDADAAKRAQHLLAHDSDSKIEGLLERHVAHLHAPASRLVPKKQTLLFSADLGHPAHAGHVLQGVKAVLEDSEKALRVGTNRKRELASAIVVAVGTTDDEAHLRFVIDTLSCVARGKSFDAMRAKLSGLLATLGRDSALATTLNELVAGDESAAAGAISDVTTAGLQQLATILQRGSPPDVARLYINGYPIELPSSASLTDEDMRALIGFDDTYRSQAVGRAFVKKSVKLSAPEADRVSLEVVKVCGLVDKYKKPARAAGLEGLERSELAVRLPGDPALQVAAYLDPLSEAAQMSSALLLMLHKQLNASVELVLLPAADYAEFPLQRFYRYAFDTTASLASPSAEFRRLPLAPILTMKIETPEAWNVQVARTQEDLDNLRVDPESAADVRATKSAVFRLESLLVYGQCRDKTFEQYTPPHGLQLVLERDVGATRLHRDTLVMRNLGYFQLQATPGVWALHLARGRATELFEIVDNDDTDAPRAATPVHVYDFGSRIQQLLVRKRAGRELDDLLDPSAVSATTAASQDNTEPIAADAGVLTTYWDSMLSLLGKARGGGGAAGAADSSANASDAVAAALTTTAVNRGRSGETLHVFSLASGHLYERFLKIMMASVLKRTRNPVTFWLLENFLSPAFKQSIPALRDVLGMDIRLVTYKWPNWLRQQTQKQRVIWGYKILFLDVLFPLGVQKIIYVDADQVVRADLKELWDMDLEGAPYGYTPFCDARNVGFQFWRQGYWKDHLRGRPYHISALYVVDLALFRQLAAGDALRATYDQLSADPNSLANLDQDLPNYMQHQLKIFSLPQEWLWCDSWCSAESKARAKTIDLCNNPKHKEPKLDMAKRVISGELFPESWLELDQEIRDAETQFVAQAA